MQPATLASLLKARSCRGIGERRRVWGISGSSSLTCKTTRPSKTRTYDIRAVLGPGCITSSLADPASGGAIKLVKKLSPPPYWERPNANLIDASRVSAAADGQARLCPVPIGANAVGPARLDTQDAMLCGTSGLPVAAGGGGRESALALHALTHTAPRGGTQTFPQKGEGSSRPCIRNNCPRSAFSIRVMACSWSCLGLASQAKNSRTASSSNKNWR